MSIETFQIEIYQDNKGQELFVDWLESLSDSRARAKIKVRLARIRLGNLGDYKPLGSGLYELRVDEGIGYRIYFTQDLDKKIILLGGSKKSQSKDIDKARKCLKDYRS